MAPSESPTWSPSEAPPSINSEYTYLCDLLHGFTNGLSVLSDWDCSASPLNTDFCSYSNVLCDTDKNIASIILGNLDLQGTISTSVAQLSHLTTLRLINVGVESTIPTEFGLLTNLRYLQIQGNPMSGTIPTQIGQLVNLIGLAIIGCRIIDPIPVEIFSIPTLNNLLLEHNQLSVVPEEICSLTSLQYLTLNDNPSLDCVPACVIHHGEAPLVRLVIYGGPSVPCESSVSPTQEPSSIAIEANFPTGAPSIALLLPYPQDSTPSGHPTQHPTVMSSEILSSPFPTGNPTSHSKVGYGDTSNAPTGYPTILVTSPQDSSNASVSGYPTSSPSLSQGASSSIPTGTPTWNFRMFVTKSSLPTGHPTESPISDDSVTENPGDDDFLYEGDDQPSNAAPTGHPTRIAILKQPSTAVGVPISDDDKGASRVPSPFPTASTNIDNSLNQGASGSNDNRSNGSSSSTTLILVLILVAACGGGYYWFTRFGGKRRSRDFHSSRIKGILEGGRSNRDDVELNLWNNEGDDNIETTDSASIKRKEKKFSLGLGSGKPNRREYARLELEDNE